MRSVPGTIPIEIAKGLAVFAAFHVPMFIIVRGVEGPAHLDDYVPIASLAAVYVPESAVLCHVGRKRRLRWERKQRGECFTCGYDLCVTPRRFLECGTATDGGTVSA